MKGQYTKSPNWKGIAGAAVAGIALATLGCELDRVERNILGGTTWIALEALRTAVLAGGRSLPAHLYEHSACLQRLFQMAASVWPLLCVLVG